ncbi:MAG: formylmethanofuran dehydrogenase subunit A [Planctomycetota bacterium]
MTGDLFCIRGGRVIDPASGHDAVADLWIRGDRIVSPPHADLSHADLSQAERSAGKISVASSLPGTSLPATAQLPPSQIFDASGCAVIAGGVDLHTHIGGGKLSLARLLMAEQLESATDPGNVDFLPSAPAVGQKYLDLGYTTCLEPAVLPCNARGAHMEMAATRVLDTGGYCILGNDEALLEMIAADVDPRWIQAYVAAVVRATACIGVKVVNPGGINAFKFNQRELDVDQPHPRYGITPAQIIRTLCQAVDAIGLPHPLHVHASNLGVPGNIDATLKTIAAADGHRLHLTHAQFHCYTRTAAGMGSAAEQLARAVAAHPNVTIDVGQIMFGQTVTISADAMHQFANLPNARPRTGAIVDVECQAGCGVVPFRYRRKRFVNALQWAIGLELFLMIEDPTRVFLTTDHPNGAPFTAYPHLMSLLSDRGLRETALDQLEPDAAAASSLRGIQRQYDLRELTRMTRSGPAALLGLRDRGRLSPGSMADVIVVPLESQLPRGLGNCLGRPRAVFRRGVLVRRDGEVVQDAANQRWQHQTLAADIRPDADDYRDVSAWLDDRDLARSDAMPIAGEEFSGVLGSKLQRVPAAAGDSDS